jgi:polyhydroxyalkanoate synthesis repressor PhaR
MSEPEKIIRVIKKYPNRRVYDTHLSKYIKIDDLREMIIEGIEFNVIDTKTKEDVTRSVLLQIILEQESENNPLFSSDNLKHFIRYYDHNHSVMFSAYLTQSLQFFNQQQDQLNQQFSDLLTKNPVENFKQFNQKNIDMWQTMQKQFFDSFKVPESKHEDEK